MMNRKEEVADILLSLGCVELSPHIPFTYTSGLQGPIYCDNRKLLSYVKERERIIDCFVEMISENVHDIDQFAGLATAGIPHAAFLAQRLAKPMLYIRSKAKEHGQHNQIEGHFQVGQRILLVEDLVNQGNSLEKAVQASKSVGLIPSACISIVDYQMEISRSICQRQKISIYSLTDFDTLVAQAIKLQKITSDDKEMLLAWRTQPKNWKPTL